MVISVLYISYTGLLEPLGYSQVLQYVKGLAQNHRMTLLSFEKPEALQDQDRLTALVEECRAANVDWHYLKYHNRPNLPATLYDIAAGVSTGIRLARNANATIVHCRSYPAGLMGLLVKRATGAKHIFDMRGFWPDERVDAGLWKKQSLRYRITKRLERALLQGTDHVVSLTRSGVAELSRFPYLQARMPPVSVIPTCTNLQLFSPNGTRKERNPGFTLGYVGSTGSWYLFDQVARVVNLLFKHYPESRFLVINRGPHDFIYNHLLQAGVDVSRVEIKAVAFEEVPLEIDRMHAGIFFIKPMWSKLGSCPTRMGEFLAMGKPCLANGKIGDVEQQLCETQTGVVINEWDLQTLQHALNKLVALCEEPGIAQRCRVAAQQRFSLDGGIKSYAAIYASLASMQQRNHT